MLASKKYVDRMVKHGPEHPRRLDAPIKKEDYPFRLTLASGATSVNIATGNWYFYLQNGFPFFADGDEAPNIGDENNPYIIAELDWLNGWLNILADTDAPTPAEYTYRRLLYQLEYVGATGSKKIANIIRYQFGDIIDRYISVEAQNTTWSDGGTLGTGFEVVTDVKLQDGVIQKRWRDIKIRQGGLSIGRERDWA